MRSPQLMAEGMVFAQSQTESLLGTAPLGVPSILTDASIVAETMLDLLAACEAVEFQHAAIRGALIASGHTGALAMFDRETEKRRAALARARGES
jgi:hypothetical protein